MFLKKSDFKNQNGRTMLEILAVIVIMAVLTVIGIVVYSQAVAKHSVNLIYEDVLMQGEQFRHRSSATGKSIFDSAVGNKTRSGFQMFSLKEGATFSIVVHDIPMDNCNGLKEKKWPTDQVARIRINNTEYAPDKIECNVSENFNLTVVFWSNFTLAKDFKTNEDCVAHGFIWNNGKCAEDLCDTCSNNQTCLTIFEEKKCVSACPTGQTMDEETGTCTNNKCSDYTNCDEGYFCNFDSACATTGTCKDIDNISSTTGTLTVGGTEYTVVCSAAGSNILGSFYKAQDWCLAMGGRLLTYTETCNIANPTGVSACPDNDIAIALSNEIYSFCNAGHGSDWMWTTHPSNNRNSCYMFSFRLDGLAGTYEYGNKSDRRALCLLPS